MADTALVQPSVGAALRFVREHWRFVLRIAVIGGAASALAASLSFLSPASPALGFVSTMASSVVQAFVYAALVGAVLFGPGALAARWWADGGRVWLAMLVVGFFLFIVFFVLSIPVMIVLIAGPLAPYVPALQRAGEDPQAVLAVMTRFAEANAGVILLMMVVFFALWLAITSRLYLAAPATVDQKRILTFETWRWTKGAMLKIIGARLMLLVPANIVAVAVAYVVGRLVGIDPSSMTPTGGIVAVMIYIFAGSFAKFALYSALEAGLSTAMYRALKPPTPPPAA